MHNIHFADPFFNVPAQHAIDLGQPGPGRGGGGATCKKDEGVGAGGQALDEPGDEVRRVSRGRAGEGGGIDDNEGQPGLGVKGGRMVDDSGGHGADFLR